MNPKVSDIPLKNGPKSILRPVALLSYISSIAKGIVIIPLCIGVIFLVSLFYGYFYEVVVRFLTAAIAGHILYHILKWICIGFSWLKKFVVGRSYTTSEKVHYMAMSIGIYVGTASGVIIFCLLIYDWISHLVK